MRILRSASCLLLVIALMPAWATAAEPAPIPADIITGSGTLVTHVKVFSGGTLSERQSFLAYGAFAGGVRVAAGDVNGDGRGDIITGTGPGAAHVKVFDGLTGGESASFLAYGAYTGGVFVAAGDVNGDGRDDIITGAETTPHVKVFDGATLAELRSFLAYAPGFIGGVRVAAGDVNGDGTADILTATGPGAAHVKVFDGVTSAEIHSFLPYATFTGGVFVAAGDVNGDGRADIITGTDSVPHVKVFDGATLAELRSFLAYSPTFSGGVRVAAGDVNGDGTVDIVTATGPGSPAHVKAFSGTSGAEIYSFLPYGGFTGGAFVASGPNVAAQDQDRDGDGIPDNADPDMIAALVDSLSADAFSSHGHRNATLSRLNTAEEMILADDTAGAIQQLRDLLKRLDGCPSDPTSGEEPEVDDWIVDCDAQRAVGLALSGVIAALAEDH